MLSESELAAEKAAELEADQLADQLLDEQADADYYAWEEARLLAALDREY